MLSLIWLKPANEKTYRISSWILAGGLVLILVVSFLPSGMQTFQYVLTLIGALMIFSRLLFSFFVPDTQDSGFIELYPKKLVLIEDGRVLERIPFSEISSFDYDLIDYLGEQKPGDMWKIPGQRMRFRTGTDNRLEFSTRNKSFELKFKLSSKFMYDRAELMLRQSKAKIEES